MLQRPRSGPDSRGRARRFAHPAGSRCRSHLKVGREHSMRPARATRTAPCRTAHYVCQPLEPRTLLDGDGEDPAVTINGTAGNDLIVIERAGTGMLVTVNGFNHGVPATVLTIRVNARCGNDEVRLDSMQRDVN